MAQAGRPLGVGIIGAGQILKHHAVAYLSHPELARLVAVADVDRGRAEAARQLYGMQHAHDDYRELLKRDDIDVISLCTRPHLRLEPLLEAVRAGKHVLCEKPIARTLREADEIVATCERHPEVRVSVLYQWRADPTVRLFQKLAGAGRLGELVLADVHLRAWRHPSYYEAAADRESWEVDGGGVLIVIAIHQLDVLLTLLGEPSEVSARMDTRARPTSGEDTLVAWIRFRSGALATLRATVCDHENRFEIDLLGEEAALHLEGGGPRHGCRFGFRAHDRGLRKELSALARAELPRRRGPSPLGVRVLERLYRLRGRPWLPPRDWWHTPTVRAFLEAVAADAPAPVPPLEARRSLELVTAIYASALSGETVALPLDESSPFYAGVNPSTLAAGGGRG